MNASNGRIAQLLGAIISTSLAGLLIGLPGCEAESPEDVDEVDSALSQSLLYEGTCAYLIQCSAPSKAAGSVQWACPQSLRQQNGCTNSMPYLAAPSAEFCGLTVRICKGGTCTNGIVQDVSNIAAWEAGNAVMNALGNYPVPPAVCGNNPSGTITADIKAGVWGAATVTAVGATKVAYFNPGLAGYHAVEYVTDPNLLGSAELCWRDGNAAWSCWATPQVTQQKKRTVLYSGSASINYRVTFKAPATGQIKYRFHTAPGL